MALVQSETLYGVYRFDMKQLTVRHSQNNMKRHPLDILALYILPALILFAVLMIFAITATVATNAAPAPTATPTPMVTPTPGNTGQASIFWGDTLYLLCYEDAQAKEQNQPAGILTFDVTGSDNVGITCRAPGTGQGGQ